MALIKISYDPKDLVKNQEGMLVLRVSDSSKRSIVAQMTVVHDLKVTSAKLLLVTAVQKKIQLGKELIGGSK